MREMEFLPDWYRTLNKRRRWVMIQAWLTLAVILVLGMYVGLGARNVRADAASLKMLQDEVDATNVQLQKLQEAQNLRRQLTQQADIVARLGPHVPTAKILNALDEMMPPQMGLLNISMDDEKTTQKTAGGLAAAAGADAQADRRLVVNLHGVAPTGIEVGNFLAKLATVPYISNINPKFSKDRQERLSSGHVMSEFEVEFTINLNSAK